MLLSVSESLTQFGDWIGQHFAELGALISMPVLIGFICKIIFTVIKNKQIIKGATLSAINTFKDGIKELRQEIAVFGENFDKRMSEFDAKLDSKFDNLRQKRKELYNQIMETSDKIEMETQEVLQQVEEKIEEVEKDTIEELEKLPESVVEETTVDADDILR